MDDEQIDRELIERDLMPEGPAGPAAELFIDMAHAPEVDRYRGAMLGAHCRASVAWTIAEQAGIELSETRWKPRSLFDFSTLGGERVAIALLIGGDRHPDYFHVIARAPASSLQLAVSDPDARIWLPDLWMALPVQVRPREARADAGVALRAAPLGLAFGRDLEKLRREVARSAVVSHTHRDAIACGIAQAYAVARLTRTPARGLDRRVFATELAAVLENFASREMIDAIERTAGPPDERWVADDPETRSSGISVLTDALVVFFDHAEDPLAAVAAACDAEHNAAKVAALTGGLVGAYHGGRALMKGRLRRVFEHSRCRELADRLHERFVGGTGTRQPDGGRRPPPDHLTTSFEPSVVLRRSRDVAPRELRDRDSSAVLGEGRRRYS